MTKPISSEKLSQLAQVIQTVHRLRAPQGCPWDRAQTHQTLRPYLIEEAYEVLDVLDRIDSPDTLRNDEKTRAQFCEELGDLLMQVLLHSEMTDQEGLFDFCDVAQGLNEKLIRRHPHVFGEQKVDSADAALQSWEKQKAIEKEKDPAASVLDGLPKGLPSLQRTARMIAKVTQVGFQWKDWTGPLGKVEEEIGELKAEISKHGTELGKPTGKTRERIEAEIGDLLFSVSNLAYMLGISAEDSLRGTTTRFESRFRHVERGLKIQGKPAGTATLQEMDVLWNEAKALEKNSVLK